MSEPYPTEPMLHPGKNYHMPLLPNPRNHSSSEDSSKGQVLATKDDYSPIRISSSNQNLNNNYSSHIPRYTDPPKPFEPSPYGSFNHYNHRPPVSLKTNGNGHTSIISPYTKELAPLPHQPHQPHQQTIPINGEHKRTYEYKPYSFANLLHPEPNYSLKHKEITATLNSSYPVQGDRLDQVLPNPEAHYPNKLMKISKKETNSISSPGTKYPNVKSNNVTYQCKTCNKVYKQLSCLNKHEWEHDPHWKEVSKLALPKNQQIQLMEAAQILMDISRAKIEPSS